MKLMFKVIFNLAGLLFAAAAITAAVTFIGGRASERYADEGAYDAELLVWKQDSAEEGRLMICGHEVRIGMDVPRRLEDGLEAASSVIEGFVPENLSAALRSLWTSLRGAILGLLEFLF